MLKVVLAENDHDVNGLIAKANTAYPNLLEWSYDNAYAISIFDDDKMAAIILYHNNFRQKCNIEMSIVSFTKKWASRKILYYIFSIPFIIYGMQRVTAISRQSNILANKLLHQVGFKVEGYHPLYYDNGETAISWGIIKKDCIWIGNEKNG